MNSKRMCVALVAFVVIGVSFVAGRVSVPSPSVELGDGGQMYNLTLRNVGLTVSGSNARVERVTVIGPPSFYTEYFGQ